MISKLMRHKRTSWLVFGLVFIMCVIAGGLLGKSQTAAAAPAEVAPQAQTAAFAGPDTCVTCHKEIVELWQETRHAHAFSSPVFQRDWTDLGSNTTCLACHTTGYDSETGKYALEGITCESCHGPLDPKHPMAPMAVTPDVNLCGTCHKTTTDEWMASNHGSAGIDCQSCHDPHAQQPKAATVTELCTNCHKEGGETFAHSTHSNAGLECSNCHMYTKPLVQAPIEGVVPTGHTFSVGSDTCIACHQDTVHSRNEIVKLEGEVKDLKTFDPEILNQTIEEQKQQIASLETISSNRLYTGLAQGAIIGLMMGGVSAWIVSKRIKIFEVEENG